MTYMAITHFYTCLMNLILSNQLVNYIDPAFIYIPS